MPLVSTQSLCEKALSTLPERSREVLGRRFGLAGEEPETLQAIGDDYELTRERVRQIESDALRELRRPDILRDLAVFARPVESHVRAWGGFRREERLFNELGEELGFRGEPQHFHFLLTLTDPFERHPASEYHHHLWAVEEEALVRARKLLVALGRELSKLKQPQSFEALCELAQALCRRLRLASDRRAVKALASSSVDAASFISSNPFGEYGLRSWERIQPKSTGSRAYLVLEKEGKPMHFREIAKKISEVWERGTHQETVHNELIKDPRFVLVGRGTYALAEWGYQPGTVAEVMAEALEAAGRPLGRDEVLQQVLRSRLVKPSTVLLNLSNRRLFARTPEGKYILRK